MNRTDLNYIREQVGRGWGGGVRTHRKLMLAHIDALELLLAQGLPTLEIHHPELKRLYDEALTGPAQGTVA